MVLCSALWLRGCIPSISAKAVIHRDLWLLWKRVPDTPPVGFPNRASNDRTQIRGVQSIQKILSCRPFQATFKTQSQRNEREVDKRFGKCLYEGRDATSPRESWWYGRRLRDVCHIRPFFGLVPGMLFCDPFLVPCHLLFSVLFSPLGNLADFSQLF